MEIPAHRNEIKHINDIIEVETSAGGARKNFRFLVRKDL